MKHGTVRDILSISTSKTYRPDLATAYKSGKARLKIKLGQAQIISAITDKNPIMMIWLGKQYLQQQDKVTIENTHEIKGEIANIEDLSAALAEKATKMKQIESGDDEDVIDADVIEPGHRALESNLERQDDDDDDDKEV